MKYAIVQTVNDGDGRDEKGRVGSVIGIFNTYDEAINWLKENIVFPDDEIIEKHNGFGSSLEGGWGWDGNDQHCFLEKYGMFEVKMFYDNPDEWFS